MSKRSLYKDIVLETYQKMYEVSEPKLDFMNYIETTCNYSNRDTNEKIVTDKHLSLEEMHDRNLCIDVPFEEHFIEKDVAVNILNEQVKKYKLNNSESEKLRTQIWLGCSPAFKKEI